jgi:hypothetical protein
MYTILDANTLSVITPDRDRAEQLLVDLKRDAPDSAWSLFTAVNDVSVDELEMLYALTAELLSVSGANPVNIQLEVPQMDGSVNKYSAVRIMHMARNWLDQVQEQH